MTKLIRIFLVAALAFSGALYGAGVATADVENANAANVQEGDNETESEQSGSAESGDAVGGQVTGIVSSGDASVDATNVSEDVDVETGDAVAENDAATFTGQNVSGFDGQSDVAVAADIDNAFAVNLQEGDNETDYSQSANAASGDGVGGQVIGAVTSAGGSADIVAANTSEDVDIDTGDAYANNEFAAFVGQNVADNVAIGGGAGAGGGSTPTAVADIDNSFAFRNLQEGDNDLSSSQAADAASGDGVGGQVIGAVSAGDTSIDATNVSRDVDIDTGDAEATNAQAAFVGQNFSNTLAIGAGGGGTGGGGSTPTAIADIDNAFAVNLQEGDNSADLSQAADAASGDGVGGQVIGAVTAAGGSADIVADNTSEDVDVETGDAFADNENAAFVGQNVSNNTLAIGGGALFEAATPTANNNVSGADVTNAFAFANLQEGDNDLDGSQDASAATGDGVGGQVLGVVSAGDASIDATNVSEDVDVETGESEALNDAASFVGQNAVGFDTIVAADIDNAFAFANLQEGDNERSFSQSADSASGDAVAGQVAGVVTSAGGSADAVLDNTSEDIDAETGETTFDNDDAGFVGQNFNFFGDLLVVS